MSIPESFWTEDAPIGEVPPMNEHAAMDRVIARVQRDILDDRESVVRAAKEWRAIELRVEYGSTEWQVATERLRDAVDRLPITFDIPGALVANRTAETSRLNMTGLARGIFTGGA